LGDYTVAQVAFRCLDFMAGNGWRTTPRGRIVFWGDQGSHPGSKSLGIGAEELLGRFLRDDPLESAQNEVSLQTRADLEWYALRAVAPSGERRYAIYAAPYTTASAAVESLTLPASSATMRVETFVISMEEGIRKREASVSVASGRVSVRFEPPWEMDIRESVVVLVSPAGKP